MSDKPTDSRLLVVELHHLGDAVISLPFVEAARRRHSVQVLCRPAAKEIYSWILREDAIHCWDPPWHEETTAGASNYRRGVSIIRRIKPDVAVCVWADPRVHYLMWKAGVPSRIGFPVSPVNFLAHDFGPRKMTYFKGLVLQRAMECLPGVQLLTGKLSRPSVETPQIAAWSQVASSLQTGDTALESTGILTEDDPRREATKIPEKSSPHIAIAPHARLPSKMWSTENFRELARRLASECGARITWLLPPGIEIPGPDGIAPDRISTIHTENLASFREVMTDVHLLIGNDSLAGHLADACGCATISVFTTGNPSWFPPAGNRENAVFEKFTPTDPEKDTDGNPTYVKTGGPSVDAVFEKARTRLPEPKSPNPHPPKNSA